MSNCPSDKFMTVGAGDMGFDLKQPCKDCPFLKATPKHTGVLKALPDYVAFADMGRLAHSCHKTDPRADSVQGKKFKGKVQHCAGLLAIMAKDVSIISPLVLREVGIDRLIEFGEIKGVYKNLTEMVMDYGKWLKAGRPNDLGEVMKKELKSMGLKTGTGEEVDGKCGNLSHVRL